jgi:hypothetical protein
LLAASWRIYFDVSEPAAYYAKAVRRLHPVSYLMGELLDSSDERHISVTATVARLITTPGVGSVSPTRIYRG